MLIAASQITQFYGKQDIFRGTSFHVQFGEKVGLVGPNGSGKSTLLGILLGQIPIDEGEIHRARHVRIGHLPQDVLSIQGRSVLEHVLEVAEELRAIELETAELERELEQADDSTQQPLAERLSSLVERYQFLGGYELKPKAEKILAGLGFDASDMEKPVETLSGGWAMRAAMARLLLSDPDLLLLDEPTNHLDLGALRWLEEYLAQASSAVVIISHDRVFLNHLVSRIVEIEDGQLVSYQGNYDAYRQQKSEKEAHRLSAYKAQQEEIRQMQRFIDRNRARKDRARQVQSRLKTLDKMVPIELPQKPGELKFRFPPAPPSARVVTALERITHEFDGKKLYRDATLSLYRGNRVAIVGPNGSGKTTLLKILAGQLLPKRGTRRLGQGVKVSYFAQHQMELLNPEKTVLEELMDSALHPHQGELRNLLGAFQFRGDAVFKRIKVLSGGEKSRLLLCKILLQGGNFLLLDEPTNHLDIASREVLEGALKDFDGTLCLVTHDRRLMNTAANHILVIRDGAWDLLPGNYDDFERIWLKGKIAPEPETMRPEQVQKKDRDQKRKEAEWRNQFYRLKKPLEEEIERLESEVDEGTRRLEEIRSEMANPELYRSPDRVQSLQMEDGKLKAQLDALTRQWEELQAELEDLELRMEQERPV